MAIAASSARDASRNRIDAQPSGEMTEYTACSSMLTRSPIAIASAPPLPPSPVTVTMIGVRRLAISRRLYAIASACPRSSASMPG